MNKFNYKGFFKLLSENISKFSIFLVFFLIIKYYFVKFRINISDFIFILENIYILLSIFSVLLIYISYKIIKFLFSLIKSSKYDLFFTYIYLIFFVFLIIYNINILLILLYYLIGIIIISFLLLINVKENKIVGILVPDIKLDKDKEDYKDELGFEDKIKDFSKILYNNGSKDNQVFGLVAEWGAGKSSFLNLLKDEESIKKNCIYIDFNVWYYENEKELLEKFLDNIILNLKENNYYLSNLSNTFSKFIDILNKNSNSIFGFNFNFGNKKTLEELKNNINDSLKNIDKKLIIVIDDLDRISSDKLKEVFKIVDLCRDFYNTSYILCYDPLNFNSIDNNLIETISQNNGEILNINTENVDNKELIKYMSKIINVYYSLEVDIIKLKNYFNNLFKNGKYINVSIKSEEGIKKGIDNLFSLENYRFRGEYYSNVRGMKRILNNLITLNRSITSDNNYIYNLFDIEGGGLEFDIFVKFILLKLYKNNLYKDIQNEFLISGISYNYFLIDNKYSLGYGSNDRKENIEYEKYLNSLNINEFKLLNNIIPKYNGVNNSLYNDKIKLREGNNIKKYIDFIQTNTDIGYNRFFLSKIDHFKTNISLENIFNDIYSIYGISGLDKFISEFIKQIWSWEEKDDFKQNKAIELIDFLINYDIFYKFDIKDKFTFYIDIASILNNSSPYDNSNSDNLKYIGEYFYGEGIYEKSIYNKILDKGEDLGTDEGKIISLRETLRLLFSIDERRGGNFFNFWNGVGDSLKFYNGIYNEFKNRYINKDINILKYIFEWEKNINNGSRSMITHITYMLTNYGNEESKKELSDYFIKCFNEDLNLFLKFLESYVKDSDRLLRGKNKIFYIDINGFYENFIKEDIIKFSNDNKEKLKEISNKDLIISSIYQGGENIELNQKELLEEFYIRLG